MTSKVDVQQVLKPCPMGCDSGVLGGEHEEAPVYCGTCWLRAVSPRAWNTRIEAQTISPATAEEREVLRAAIINTPETADFMAAVPIEAAHQRERWGADHDMGKTPFDWFWLIGYLAQKAAASAVAGDTEKALHHTISTAAALANWHANLAGLDTRMVPGAPLPVQSQAEAGSRPSASTDGDREVERLRAALKPFVRSCETFGDDDFPLHIGNDDSASPYDLTIEEVTRARTALEEAGNVG